MKIDKIQIPKRLCPLVKKRGYDEALSSKSDENVIPTSSKRMKPSTTKDDDDDEDFSDFEDGKSDDEYKPSRHDYCSEDDEVHSEEEAKPSKKAPGKKAAAKEALKASKKSVKEAVSVARVLDDSCQKRYKRRIKKWRKEILKERLDKINQGQKLLVFTHSFNCDL